MEQNYTAKSAKPGENTMNYASVNVGDCQQKNKRVCVHYKPNSHP